MDKVIEGFEGNLLQIKNYFNSALLYSSNPDLVVSSDLSEFHINGLDSIDTTISNGLPIRQIDAVIYSKAPIDKIKNVDYDFIRSRDFILIKGIQHKTVVFNETIKNVYSCDSVEVSTDNTTKHTMVLHIPHKTGIYLILLDESPSTEDIDLTTLDLGDAITLVSSKSRQIIIKYNDDLYSVSNDSRVLFDLTNSYNVEFLTGVIYIAD